MKFRYNLIGTPIGFNNVLDTILKNRGVDNIKDFLNTNESHLENEYLYDNIELAFINLLTHIHNNSKIVIVVDPDPDGYTSAAIMYQYIIELIKENKKHTTVEYIIHDDKKHGIDDIIKNKIIDGNYNLVILPDSSSNDYEEHKFLKEKGIDLIVLDHHESDKYSEYAIVVNNQLSSKITNKSMTGVGVVYKFCKYIDTQLDLKLADNYLDLVSVGMIGDVCDLRNLESRYLVSQGLEIIQKEQNKNTFISALIKEKAYDMQNEVSIIGLAFYIVPMINAIVRNGTIEDKELMFKALINSNEKYMDKIRGKGEVELSIQDFVVRIANKCKRLQTKLTEEGLKLLIDQINTYKLDEKGIIIANATDTINKNYTGLIANKLASLYQRPCLLLSEREKGFGGSGRGFERKDIKDFKGWCVDTGLFTLAEGHSNAFGVFISEDNINTLYEIATNLRLSDELIYDVDGIFNDKTLSNTVIESIAKYKNIWGTTVYEPMFAIENIIINTKDIELIGKTKNTLKMNYKNITIMQFKSNEDIFNNIKQHKAIQITAIGKFNVNKYNGKTTPQIIIQDMMYIPAVIKFRF